MNELQGVLTTDEIRTRQDKPKRREATFQEEKQTLKKKPKEKACSSCSEESDDEEIANFVRNLKRGTINVKVSFLLYVLIVVKLVIFL